MICQECGHYYSQQHSCRGYILFSGNNSQFNPREPLAYIPPTDRQLLQEIMNKLVGIEKDLEELKKK